MSVQMLTHIGICVSDLERARAFYTEILGFTEVGGLSVSGDRVDALLGLAGADVEIVGKGPVGVGIGFGLQKRNRAR